MTAEPVPWWEEPRPGPGVVQRLKPELPVKRECACGRTDFNTKGGLTRHRNRCPIHLHLTALEAAVWWDRIQAARTVDTPHDSTCSVPSTAGERPAPDTPRRSTSHVSER